MKIFILINFIFFSSCKENKGTKSTEQEIVVSTDTLSTKNLFIQDESKYSKSFIKSLIDFTNRDRTDTKYYLTENKIRLSSVSNKYTNYEITFPSLPEIKKNYILQANKNGALYELKLFQLNYTEIEFQILLKKGLSVIYSKKGIVNLSPGFIIAGESYEDDETNGGYGAFSYLAEDPCPILLCFGNTEEGLKGVIREIPCADEIISDLISKLPTLRQVK